MSEYEFLRLLTDPWNPFIKRDLDKEYDATIQVQAMIQRALAQPDRKEQESLQQHAPAKDSERNSSS
jgi:hypothetical protein